MPTRPRRNARLAAALVVLGAAMALPAAQQDPARAEAQLKALVDRIAREARQLQQNAAEKDQVGRDLRDTEKSVAKAQAELDRLRAERAERAAIRRHLENERAEREAEQRRTEEELARQLRAAYFMGRNEPLKLLLNQRSPAEFSRNLVYYGYLGRLRADQIREITDNIAKIEDLSANIAAEDAKLAELEAAQQKQVAELESARRQRGQALARLEREGRDRNASLQRLRREQQQLERVLEEARKAAKALPYDPNAPFAQTRGRLSWPTAGRLSVNYGATIPGIGKSTYIEIDTVSGAKVTAIHEGRIEFADYIDGRGNLVYLNHGNGYSSVYGHLDQLLRAAGTTVKGGEVIGTAGESGGRKDPGLYFAIYRNDTPVDPRGWFRSTAPPLK